MLKKMGKIGLALVLVIGLLPMMSLRAYAAVPSFNKTADFVIEPSLVNTTNKSVTDAEGLPNGKTAVILSTFAYVGNSSVYTHYLKVFDNTGTLVTDINLSTLMDTYYQMTDVNMLALSNGDLLITYNKSDSSPTNLPLGTVIESTPNTYFMVLNQYGQKLTSQTQINTYSDASLPQLTRFVSIAELSNGDIAFSWQRNDNVSTATRVFTAAGTPVSSETLLVGANASMSYVSAGDGVYMVAYNSGSPNDNIYLKLFSNNGALLNTITVGARTDEKQLYLSTLNNGNFMFSQYHWQTGSSEVSLYDNSGTSQGGFTVNGYMGEASAAVYRSGALPGFVTISTDSASNDAINDAYYNGKDWSGTQYAYLNYYGYDGNLILTSAQPVDSAPVVMQGYDEQSWMYAVEYYPKFSLYPAFGDKVVFIKTDNTDASHYRITGKLFDNGAPPQGNHVFTVTNTNDSGAGSLRWAIEQAGAVSGGQVDFDPSLAGQTITLQSDLTGWNDQDWKGTTIGDASAGGFKLTGLQDATGHPAITINGNGHRGILATGSGVFEMSDIRLTGFDITDSSGKYDSFGSALGVGGNLYSSIQLNNVIFEANTMTYKKTGSIASLAALTAPYKVDLDRVVFTDNVLTATATTETTQGAALYYNSYMDGVISNSLFANNRSNSNSTEDSYGSAIGVMLDPHLKVWNNTFYNNHVNNTGTGASYGPAMYAVSSSPGSSSLDIYNNVLISNKMEAATAGTLEELFYNYNNDTLVQSGSNVISGDPFVDAAGGNFSLKGSAVSAIDQGDNTKTAGALDLAGGARIYGGTVDIGAYEYVPGPTVPVVLQSAVADGVPGTTTSTKIDLTFDAAITGLTADDITITDGTGSAVKGSLSGLGTAWSLALTSVTAEGDVSVAVNSPSGYTVSGSPQTATVSLFKPALEPTPAAVIDYEAEQLSGLTANGTYTVNGTAVTATADGTLALEQSWLGESLSIVKQGNASTTVDSAAQVLSIPSRPATPTGVTATDEMGIEANNGTLTNVTAAMEYKQGALGTWTDVTGTTVTGLAPGTYEVRVRLTASSFVSEAHSVTVNAYVPLAEPTPAAVIDYAAEQLSGLTANGAYTVNGTAVTATADGTLALEQSWLGESLSIVKQGNSTTTVDSAAQVLVIPSRPATPTGVTATDEMGIEANNGKLENVTSAMEYKLSTGGVWTDVTGIAVTGLAPGTYEVRVKMTAASFISESHSVTVKEYVPTIETTPAAVIDYGAEQLSGLMANGLYTVNGTLSIYADAAGKLALDSSWLGTSLSLVKQGNASTTIDSAAQTVSIPVRPAAPAGVTATDETAINAKNGTLTNVTPAMEYKQGAAGVWTDVTGTTVTGLAPGTYYVQTKATLTAFASEAHIVNVVAYVAIPEATPAAVIDYEAEQLSGLTANGTYTLNGTLTVTADADGKLALDNSWLGSSLSLVKQGNASTTIDSAAQTLTIPARPAAPAGVAATDETAINAKNGTLTNVTTAMEYRKGTAGAWTDVPGTSVSGLVPDTYYVRTKGTVTAFASEAQAVPVSAYVPTLEATPTAVIDYEAEQLSGLTANGTYTLNGSLTVTADADGKLALDSSWLGSSLSLVKQGNASTTIDSAAQTLNIPARPAAPAGVTATDETAIHAKDGTLTNVTTAMEYRKGTAGAWTDVTGTTVTGLAPGVYEVRMKATATAFSSAAVEVTVTSFASEAEVTPAAVIDYAAERLTGLIPEGGYTVNGTAVTATTDGTLPLDGSWLGTTLIIVKTGDGVTTTDSDAQVLSVPARQAAPVGVSVTDVTYNGANDGTLQNLTVQMEYQIGDTEAWTEVTDTSITGLAPGTYYVRVKATSTDFASAIAQVTVHDSDAVIPAAPEVVADDLNNTIVGLNTSMEFSVDDGPFVRYDGTNLPDLSGEHAVKVRVAASGSVPAGPATALTFTTNVLIPAGDLAVSASDPGGAESNGYTQIKVTPAPAEGHKLLYKNFGTGSIVVPNVGDLLTGYTLVGSEGLIPAADGDTIGIAEVDAEGMVVKYGSVIAVVALTTPVTTTPDPVSPGSGSNPNSGTPSGNAASTVTDVIVLVNGKEENAGKATTTISGNLRTTTIAVDPARLQAKLDAEGNGAVVTIPMMLDSNVIVGELSGQMIKNMENVAATLVLQTSKGSYTLPASEINIGALAARLGNGAKLEDITLRITIGDASAAMNQVVTAAASRGGLTLAAPILDFTVTASSGTSTVEVSRFNVYVSRTVALPQGVNPNRLTTGIVVDPDGTVRHVPTRIIQKDGKYYAEINSLTNSTYSVVWHPLTFVDVEKHWAKNAVNDMGSRLVINGVNESTFNPNADITRAEFAAIIVRGLGLKLGEGAAKFADVPANSWYAAAVGTASGAGLITGFEDGSFRPGDRITREQAMNIIAKAMKLTGLAEQTGTVDTAGVLAAFTDAGRVGAWAKDSLALAASAGLITGRGGNKLEAQANVTRAEVAVLIQRLLQKSELID
ncbi:cell wall/surface repeat protein [Paenibacillus sp. FSL R7-277]|uniref:S-layer homology domain-containing protein n=1 Tax=Paenibacillus sp. FSL R7-277 TaxID=1227352 RepID=UPI0003E1CC25|nr:S-layer homology domain-containing protein [Paenibacillus sp. FSL R7-277]ETT61943.1 cell wall/surface repeat protein [Paenibacillus sp. FSL R7-277]